MATSIGELETLLGQLLDEHRRLLEQLDRQAAAMRRLDVDAMESAGRAQSATRLRIAELENRRKRLTNEIGRQSRQPGELNLRQLADLFPEQAQNLRELRRQLKEVTGQLSRKSQIAGKVAGAVLGHLNTAVRLLAGAVEQAGLYTRQGVPQVAGRIGVMEAVG